MKNKALYSKPQIEVVVLESEGIIASSIDKLTAPDTELDGPARGNNRSFWE